MSLLIVIPARGGSKGIPLKNIYPLCGKPLLEYAVECAIESGIDADIVVSTDSDRIASVASAYENIIVIKRPNEYSHDTASTESALVHALYYCKKELGKEYTDIMTLPVTSPLRKSETVKAFYDRYLEVYNEHDAMLTLHENRDDHWIQREDGVFERLYKDAPRRRQERQPLYIENSSIYVTRVKSLIDADFILGYKPTGFVIDVVEGIDINEAVDIEIAEKYIEMK